MSDINFIFGLLAIGILIGGMWSSYRLGFREGTGKMIDFVKSKADKRGMTTMYFFGENIEFIDPLTYNKDVLDKIVDKLEERDDERS